jgi:hypothetical protein
MIGVFRVYLVHSYGRRRLLAGCFANRRCRRFGRGPGNGRGAGHASRTAASTAEKVAVIVLGAFGALGALGASAGPLRFRCRRRFALGARKVRQLLQRAEGASHTGGEHSRE